MKNLVLTYLLSFSFFCSFGQIKISTNFEGGNAQIFRIDYKKNEIIFRPALKHNQTTRCWFYFKIWDFLKNKPLKITEINDQKVLIPSYPVYSYDNKHWQKIQTQTVSEHISDFYIPTQDHDTIYFAAGYPYTYTMLLNFINSIANNSYLDTTTLTYSEHGLKIPLLVITDTSEKQDKDMVWIISRQHAFESPANFCTEGIIKYFLSDDTTVEQFRRSTIIYIVPMVDVDNVKFGASGRMQKPVDFNRDWCDNPYWHAVKEITDLIETTSEVYDFRLFIDIHATFPGTDTPVFAYFSLYQEDSPYYQNLHNFWLIFSSLFPFIPSEVTDMTVENYADRFIATHYTYIDFATTIECDWNNTDNGQQWSPKLWRQSGEKLAQTIAIYLYKPKAK